MISRMLKTRSSLGWMVFWLASQVVPGMDAGAYFVPILALIFVVVLLLVDDDFAVDDLVWLFVVIRVFKRRLSLF